MIRRGDWTKRIPNRFGAIAGLTGGKVGILGLGAIGMEFAKRIKGFDVEIGYCNRSKRSDVDFAYFPNVMALATWCRLPDRLPALGRLEPAHHQCRGAEGAGAARPSRQHQPRLGGRRGGAGRRAAQQRDRGRGPRRLRRGALRGPELLPLDNLVMTPHFGGGTEHAQRRMTSLVRRNLDAHFAGKPVVSPVPELRDMAASPAGRLR